MVGGNGEQRTPTVGGGLPVVGGCSGDPFPNRERLSDKEEIDARRAGAKMIPSSTRSPTVGALLWGARRQVE